MTAGGAARDAGRPEPWRWPPDIGPILVVEDDEALRGVLVGALAAAGHPVISAPNGAAALEQVRRRHPCLILLDLLMPVMDGRAFMEAYRQLPGPRAPVVICTANADPVGQAQRLGASDYVKKPFLLRDVLAVVGAHTRVMARSVRREEREARA